MIALPRRVKSTFLRLKEANSQYIEIKHIKKYFFVYQSTSRWDKERKKPVKVPLYMGRITDGGRFVQAKKRKPRSAIQQQVVQTTEPELDKGQKTLEATVREEKRYKHEPQILTALSMNGRISMSVLGKMIGLKETSMASQIRKLENRYKIKYIAEIDTAKLGYTRFLITVNFLDQVPKTEELKEIFSQEPLIQLVLVTKGSDYDLIIYALAKDSGDITALVYKLRTKIDYKSIWNTAPIFEGYGYIQIREEFIDTLKDKLLKREYAVLKEFNKNGNIDFTEIDRLYEFDRGRSQYSYYKLKERGVIKRITISMQDLPIKYIAVIFEDIVDFRLATNNRSKIFKEIISESTTQTNKYLSVDDTSNPAGLVACLPVFRDGELESTVENMAPDTLGIKIRAYITTSILLGNFCYRNFDNNYSAQQNVLVKDYKLKPVPKLNYEETVRTKKEHVKYIKDIRGLKPEIT